MPGVVDEAPPKKEPNKLILCFDGTGNQFTGSNGDTNVVKLLNKLDRNHAHQYHYYQSKRPICPFHKRSADTRIQLALAPTPSMSDLSISRGSAA